MLNVTNAPSIMMLAHYYDLSELEQMCAKMLVQDVSLETVCPTLERTHWLDNELTKHCLSLIQKNTDKLCDISNEHKNIFGLGLKALGKVMAMDTLAVDSEVFLFEHLLHWARSECKTKKLEPTDGNMRKTVDGRLGLIRLSTLTNDEFGRCLRLAGPDFFTLDEIGTICLRLNNKLTHNEVSSDLPLYIIPRKKYNEKKFVNRNTTPRSAFIFRE